MIDKKELIMKLRDETPWGYMDCQKALIRNNWDFEKAKSYLSSSQFKNGKLI